MIRGTLNSITSVLIRGRSQTEEAMSGKQRQKEDAMLTGFEGGGRDHEPLEKAKKEILV